MKKVKRIDNQKGMLEEKKRDKKEYRIMIGLMVVGVVYYALIEPRTIGYDPRYTMYIVALPTVIGMVILGLYRRHFLMRQFSENKGFIQGTFMTFWYLLQGIIFSYLSFGQLTKMSWDYLNSQAAKQNTEQIVTCEITRFWAGRRPGIDFLFNGRHESINVDGATISAYENKNVNDYRLTIHATKGLWNYYVLTEWKVAPVSGLRAFSQCADFSLYRRCTD